jgi:catechol 2,3-dioxygenase-like lactoylglutathione lyase family enzyme
MIYVYKISAITLSIKEMERSCKFYSRIPGFKAVYGGSKDDSFTTFEIGSQNCKEKRRLNDKKAITTYLNLELLKEYNTDSSTCTTTINSTDFGRIIFHTDDVDKLYYRFKHDKYMNKLVTLENEPADAPWGERFFHIRDPDYYQLSFAQPISFKSKAMMKT